MVTIHRYLMAKITDITRSLTFRIIAPILLLWIVTGVGLYGYVLGSVSSFLTDHIQQNMTSLASGASNICKRQHNILVNKGREKDLRLVHVAKVQVMAQLEAFFRKNNVRGLVYDQETKSIVITELFFLEDELLKQNSSPGELLEFHHNSHTYFAHELHFSPWNWRIILVSEAEAFSKFIRKIHKVYAITGLILGIVLLLVVYFIQKSISAPINSIVQQVKAGRKPDYSGIRELEFLSRSIRLMMSSLEEMNKGLGELVSNRTKALRQKARELEEANKRLTQLDTLKSSFLSSVSHELRTPLTSILGFSKIITRVFEKHFLPSARNSLKLQEKAEIITGDLSIITHEGERLTRLINDVLDLNKIESGKMIWNDELLDLEDVVASSVQFLQGSVVEASNVELVATYHTPLPAIRVDRDCMFQVMVNLINNAIKFTNQGSVEVFTEALGSGIIGTDTYAPDRVRVSVKDTGIGIHEADLKEIFTTFHQSTNDTLTQKPKGTGLGLAICKQIVEHYHGVIWAESELGKGSTIIFELPVTEPKADTQNTT